MAKITSKTIIQKGLAEISRQYWPEIPLKEICDLLKENGAELIQEDGTPWSGFLLGRCSSTDIQVKGIKTNGLCLGWYQMPSGRYEINAYLM